MESGSPVFDLFIFLGGMNAVGQKNNVKFVVQIDPKGTAGVTQVSDTIFDEVLPCL